MNSDLKPIHFNGIDDSTWIDRTGITTKKIRISLSNRAGASSYLSLKGFAESNDSLMSISDSLITFNNLLAGSTAKSGKTIFIKISPSGALQTRFALKLHLFDPMTQDSFLVHGVIPAFDSVFKIKTVLIDDDNVPDSRGNGDGIIDSGEKIEIFPVVAAKGSVTDRSTRAFEWRNLQSSIQGMSSTGFTFVNNAAGLNSRISNTFAGKYSLASVMENFENQYWTPEEDFVANVISREDGNRDLEFFFSYVSADVDPYATNISVTEYLPFLKGSFVEGQQKRMKINRFSYVINGKTLKIMGGGNFSAEVLDVKGGRIASCLNCNSIILANQSRGIYYVRHIGSAPGVAPKAFLLN